MSKHKNSKLLITGQLISGALSFIAVALVARNSDPELFGTLSLIVILLGIALDLFDFGACSWAARELTSNRISDFNYFLIMKKKVALVCAYAVVIPVVFWISPVNQRAAYLFFFYPPLWLSMNYIQHYLNSKFMFSDAIRLQLIEKFVLLFSVFFLLPQMRPIELFILPILCSLTVHVLVGLHRIRSSIEIQDELIDLSQKTIFKLSKNFGITSVVSDFANLDAPIVATLSSLVESANFSITQKFRAPIQVINNAIAIQLRSVAARGKKSEIYHFSRQQLPFALFSIVATLSLSLFMYTIGYKIFGNQYVALKNILALGILSAIPAGVFTLCSSFLSSVGLDKSVARLTTLYILSLTVGTALTSYLLGSLAAISWLLFLNTIFAIRYVQESLDAYSDLQTD